MASHHNAKSLTAGIISALGSVPYGKNYLAQHATTIMEDAIFTDVRDRSNANFLWFIKFERSFRETEQELQTSSEPTSCNVRNSSSEDTLEVQDNEQKIITMPGAASIKQDGEKRLAPKSLEKASGENIIDIAAWSGKRAGK